MDRRATIAAVLAAYPLRIRGMVPLAGAGGFSGAQFWRVETDRGTLCLRRWPSEHPSAEQLSFIHGVLFHVYQRGITQVALPLRTRRGESFVSRAGHFWELAPWMPGRADYRENPSAPRLAAALGLLARFHVAAASFGKPHPCSPSPGVRSRLELVESLWHQGCQRIAASIGQASLAKVDPLARQILEGFSVIAPAIRSSLQAAADREAAIQPCLRDVWHDHVLFTGDEVTGLVDFGALRYESVAADVARLLGSLAGSDRAAWHVGREAYEQLRPLTPTEAMLVKVFHESGVLLSGMNWLRWIYLEDRSFENWQRVLARLEDNLAALRSLQAGFTAA
jgi:Ser/Thr protein kinase RdoA (MazF antagonist)